MSARLLPALALLAACAPLPQGGSSQAATATMPNRMAAADGAERFVAACKEWDDWDKPAPPFQVLGGTWYVGTCGISSILIADPAGHILIDSGTEKGAEVVLANLRAIGVDPKDVRTILASHEHFDHVGGHAALVRATGATVVSSADAAAVFRSGKPGPDDPQVDLDHPAMAPVEVGKIIADGEEIALSPDPSTTQNRVRAHATPGHTAGALSWTWTACSLPGEPPVCRRIAYVDSLSAVSSDDYKFIDHPEWVAKFRKSFAKVAAMPCDILLTPHPSGSNLLARLRANNLEPAGQCQAYAAKQGAALDKRLADEKAKGG